MTYAKRLWRRLPIRLRKQAHRISAAVQDQLLTGGVRIAPTIRGARSRGDVPNCSIALVCIYRQRNTATVERVVRALEGGTILLWSLDGPPSAPLARWTVGGGPGGRSELLNRLVEIVPDDDQWVLVCDDDVEFVGCEPSELVALARTAGIDMIQPCHAASSEHSYEFNVCRPFVVARLTGTIEVGPVFTVSPTLRHTVFPLDTESPMGWGLEAAWSRLVDRGLRLGVADAVPIKHIASVGREYEEDHARLDQTYERAGGRAHITRTIQTWTALRRKPPWN